MQSYTEEQVEYTVILILEAMTNELQSVLRKRLGSRMTYKRGVGTPKTTDPGLNIGASEHKVSTGVLLLTSKDKRGK